LGGAGPGRPRVGRGGTEPSGRGRGTGGSPLIAVVDYDAGNLHSVVKALRSLGLPHRVTDSPRAVEEARALVLPGVGAFGDCVARLRERGLEEAVRRFVAGGRPFLGICVGLQVLFEESEEAPGVPGLGVVPGRVVRMRPRGLKVPQMGWNALRLLRPSPLFRGVPDGAHAYFVHSYHAVPTDPGVLVATVDYGGAVTAAIEVGNVYAVQFHPEKSSRVGLQVLRNFGALAGARAA
jgi:glutamine amidotransferase